MQKQSLFIITVATNLPSLINLNLIYHHSLFDTEYDWSLVMCSCKKNVFMSCYAHRSTVMSPESAWKHVSTRANSGQRIIISLLNRNWEKTETNNSFNWIPEQKTLICEWSKRQNSQMISWKINEKWHGFSKIQHALESDNIFIYMEMFWR